MEPPIGIGLLSRLLPDLGLVTITAHSFALDVADRMRVEVQATF